MQRLVSALVLSLALSGAAGDWLDHWGHLLARNTHRDTASHGTSGWSDRAPAAPIPIVEALPGTTISVDRSPVIVPAMSVTSHARRVRIAGTGTTRPHDPPRLHTFALLI